MWHENYDALSNSDKDDFRRVCNYLLSHTYIVRDTYDPGKQFTGTNPDYRFVNRTFECMREYFSVSGWRLEKDDNYGVISLVSEFDHNRLRIDRFTTLFLYVCRLIYEEGREQGDNSRIVHTDTGTVVEKMRSLSLLDKSGKTSQRERVEAQRTLAHFNIIQKTESSAWSPDGNDLLILPSILSIVSNQNINGMMQELEELRIVDQGDDQDTDTPDISYPEEQVGEE